METEKMKMSADIAELATALVKAQAIIKNAAKDTDNAYFKSKYADLAAVWDACRGPLTSNGLSVTQHLSTKKNGAISCTTMLLHTSGQWMGSTFSMLPTQNTPQAGGSCATYLRRYSLQAIVGVAPDDDDDGNAASGKSNDKADNNAKKTWPSGKAVEPNRAPIAVKTPQDAVGTTNTANGTQAVEIFSTKDPKQMAHLIDSLKSRGHVKYSQAMASILEGKPYSKQNFDAAWARVNPEAPDPEPG